MLDTKLSPKKILEKISLKPALSIFCIALSARVTVIIFSNLLKDGLLFQDDRGYYQLAKMYAESDPSFPQYTDFWNSLKSFTAPIGFLFKVFTPQAFLGQSISALAGALAASTIMLLLKPHVNKKIAFYAGVLAALYPSQVLWSSLILKDVFIWSALAATALLSQWWFKQSKILNILTGSLGILALTFYISRLRVHTLLVLCIALLISACHKKNKHRLTKTFFATGLLILLPLNAGIGVAGIDTLKILVGTGDDGTSYLTAIRQSGALKAETALADSPYSYKESLCYEEFRSQQNEPLPLDSSQEDLEECLSLISAEQYTLTDDILYLPVGIRVMLIDPLPHRIESNTSMLFAFIEHILWYPLLIFSFVGIKKFWRKPDLFLITTLGLGVATKWALVEGNFGTAYRHRSEFVWIVIVFAAIGLEKYLKKRKLDPKKN